MLNIFNLSQQYDSGFGSGFCFDFCYCLAVLWILIQILRPKLLKMVAICKMLPGKLRIGSENTLELNVSPKR